MSKKKKEKEKKEELPKFGGFKPLAGLDAFKKKLEDEAKKPNAPAPPPPPPPRRDVPKSTAAEDEMTFHRMMSGVVPLDAKPSRVPMTSEERVRAPRLKPEDIRAKARAEAEEVLGHLQQLVDDGARFEVTDDGRRVEGHRTDVPPNVMRSLRRGLLPIDARLDLHGMGAAEARERLVKFLEEKRARGERCVLVIHGKGEHSEGQPVLRGEISAWLSQGRARAFVAAFATATDADGGEGAVYVALRR
ncbi:MAG TPA: Smr/MutS family protein [Labilithrix sp.]|jgi:DNA-nicking Smr family endonuclease